MWKQAAGYGALLALGTLALQWLDYQRMPRVHAGDIYDFLLAAGFLALGLLIGARVWGARSPRFLNPHHEGFARNRSGAFVAIAISIDSHPTPHRILRFADADACRRQWKLRWRHAIRDNAHAMTTAHKIGAVMRLVDAQRLRELSRTVA